MRTSLDDLRSELTTLHFAQDAMRPHERRTLHIAEVLLGRIDAVLELCDRSPQYPEEEIRNALEDGTP